MIRITTNNVPRPVIDAWELSASERQVFDYLDWSAIERGEDSASFVRYRGELYPVSDFSAYYGLSRDAGLPAEFQGWHGYLSDSFWSGLLIRFTEDPEYVIVARFYSEEDE